MRKKEQDIIERFIKTIAVLDMTKGDSVLVVTVPKGLPIASQESISNCFAEFDIPVIIDSIGLGLKLVKKEEK